MVNTKEMKRDIKQLDKKVKKITKITRKLILDIGVRPTARLCDLSPSAICTFSTEKKGLHTNTIIRIYEKLIKHKK